MKPKFIGRGIMSSTSFPLPRIGNKGRLRSLITVERELLQLQLQPTTYRKGTQKEDVRTERA